jgi:hypothetical protein
MAPQGTATHYDLAAWADATELGRRVFNYNYRLTGDELRGWELVNAVETTPEADVVERNYLWRKKGSDGDAELIRVTLTETADWRRAQTQLQGQLLHTMRPDLPAGKGKLARIGDVRFAVGPADAGPEAAGAITAVQFVRGNVAVVVASAGSEPVDVTAIARRLDQDFSTPPKPKDLEAERALDRSPAAMALSAGEEATAITALPAPVARSGWVKVFAPDGELTRDGDRILYRPAEGGSKQLQEFLILQQPQR